METPDVASLISAYREIFLNEIYSFPHPNSHPFIIDCGSNIGLSVLYFKSLFPECRILAFEADPMIFEILKRNLELNKIVGVEIFQKAVWTSEGKLSFTQEGADGGRLDIEKGSHSVQVSSVRLAKILEASPKTDFLKIDIEGAENEVIDDCAPQLNRIPFVFVEFHSFQNRNPQGLGKLINHFESSGFRTHIHTAYTSERPFQGRHTTSGMDLQLNCFFIASKKANNSNQVID